MFNSPMQQGKSLRVILQCRLSYSVCTATRVHSSFYGSGTPGFFWRCDCFQFPCHLECRIPSLKVDLESVLCFCVYKPEKTHGYQSLGFLMSTHTLMHTTAHGVCINTHTHTHTHTHAHAHTHTHTHITHCTEKNDSVRKLSVQLQGVELVSAPH